MRKQGKEKGSSENSPCSPSIAWGRSFKQFNYIKSLCSTKLIPPFLLLFIWFTPSELVLWRVSACRILVVFAKAPRLEITSYTPIGTWQRLFVGSAMRCLQVVTGCWPDSSLRGFVVRSNKPWRALLKIFNFHVPFLLIHFEKPLLKFRRIDDNCA